MNAPAEIHCAACGTECGFIHVTVMQPRVICLSCEPNVTPESLVTADARMLKRISELEGELRRLLQRQR